MVAPIVVAAGIGAAGSLLSGAFGARANNRANKDNLAIAQMNYNAQEKARLQALFNALRADADAKMGSTDATGTRTHFVPGKGWVVDASDPMQEIIDASMFEQNQQLTEDAQLGRASRNEITGRARDAGQTADALLQQFGDVTRRDPNDVTAQLNAEATGGFNRGFDDVQNAILTNGLRTGSAVLPQQIEQLASQRGEGLANIREGNVTRGQQIADNDFSSQRGELANLFNAFQGASQGQSTIVPNAAGARTGTNAGLPLALNRSGQSEAIMANAFSRPASQKDYVAPNNALAQGFAGIGSAGQSFANTLVMQNLLKEFSDSSTRGKQGQGAI